MTDRLVPVVFCRLTLVLFELTLVSFQLAQRSRLFYDWVDGLALGLNRMLNFNFSMERAVWAPDSFFSELGAWLKVCNL